ENRHSLQSPFVYQLYQGLKTYRTEHADGVSHVEKLRQNLLSDHTAINVSDLGAGSRIFSSQKRKIREIARHSCSSKKFNLLYQYFCSLSPAETVLELGTCLGINTCYLAEVT